MPARATDALRAARARVRGAVEAVAASVGTLSQAPPAARGAAMRAVVDALDGTLRPHLAWEERTLHPIVDKFACEGPAAFSGSMRYEHEIIHRWSAELARLAGGSDVVAFARRADNLLGVVLAHFELEEQIFFPILDRTFSPAALRDAIGLPPAPEAAATA